MDKPVRYRGEAWENFLTQEIYWNTINEIASYPVDFLGQKSSHDVH